MSKFMYRMQNVLNIKYKLEEQAKMQYAAARAKLTEEEEKLTTLQKRKKGYEKENKRLLKDTLQVRKIMDGQIAVQRMDEFIKEQLGCVIKAEKNLEAAREKLQEVMIERKTHEKLREKAFEAFLEEEKAKEGREIDELTSYKYGMKAGKV